MSISPSVDSSPVPVLIMPRARISCRHCSCFSLAAILSGAALALGLAACGGKSTADLPKFDGGRAFAYLQKQCDFGPRVPGSAAHAACLDFLVSELRGRGAQVGKQSFSRQLPRFEKPVTLTNIVASFHRDKTERVLLCAHWDSRPWADQDSLVANRDLPVPGANDGASGVAVLLEVARQIQLAEPRYGVDIILFDGEDAGLPGENDSYALGSQYFAENKDARYWPRFGILLDLVGDRDLEIYQERNSLKYAPKIVKKVWQQAEELGLTAFRNSPRFEVTDDHLPLLRSGIPCIDIIDFDYPFWHTTEDTPDKCSAESLAQVGQLLLAVVYL